MQEDRSKGQTPSDYQACWAEARTPGWVPSWNISQMNRFFPLNGWILYQMTSWWCWMINTLPIISTFNRSLINVILAINYIVVKKYFNLLALKSKYFQNHSTKLFLQKLILSKNGHDCPTLLINIDFQKHMYLLTLLCYKCPKAASYHCINC